MCYMVAYCVGRVHNMLFEGARCKWTKEALVRLNKFTDQSWASLPSYDT